MAIKSVYKNITILSFLEQEAKKFGTNKIVTNNLNILKKLALHNKFDVVAKDITLDNYKGSLFYYNDLQILILPSIRPITFMPEIEFQVRRWLRKLTNPAFPTFPELEYRELDTSIIDGFLEKANDALMIAIDIETNNKQVDPKAIEQDTEGLLDGIWTYSNIKKSGKKSFAPCCPIITMVSYTCLYQNPRGELYSETGVIRINTIESVYYMRRFNNLPAVKVMQNGGYDSSYFLRYNAPVYNYLWDTYNAMHCWYSELPKTLHFIASLFDKNYIYWKSESDTNMVEYAAKDTHNTLWAMVHIISQWPDWAFKNYCKEFRYKFPNITMGLEGWAVNEDTRAQLRTEREQKLVQIKASLGKMVKPNFNPNSPKQVVQLMQGIGFRKAKNSKETTVQAFIDAHPLGDRLGSLILDYKGNLKAVSTYYDIGLFNGRAMYELNECGTESGRFSSKASNFWCGLQIQNVPPYAKGMFIADNGWVINSCDYAQSESYCVGFQSQDKNLLKILSECAADKDKDFHQLNGSMFFGVPPKEVTGSNPGDIRWLTKKVNHGANYNMKWLVMFQTMRRKNVFKAARLLKLSTAWGPKQICEHLLKLFEKAYPDVKDRWYREIMAEITTTGKLVTSMGWTRRCLRNPDKNQHVYNSYVSHLPQSLSVERINDALFDIWLELQIGESKIRLKAQVHDDIIWQDRPEDTESNTERVEARMLAPTQVKDRKMVIPVDSVTGCSNWAETK